MKKSSYRIKIIHNLTTQRYHFNISGFILRVFYAHVYFIDFIFTKRWLLCCCFSLIWISFINSFITICNDQIIFYFIHTHAHTHAHHPQTESIIGTHYGYFPHLILNNAEINTEDPCVCTHSINSIRENPQKWCCWAKAHKHFIPDL